MLKHNIYTNKLLEISSESMLPKYDSKNFDEELNKILEAKNGFYAFESALHFFSDQEIKLISRLMKNKYPYDGAENCLFFANDVFGNLYCFNADKRSIYLLDLESGSMDKFGSTFEDWSENILNDYDYMTGYTIAHDWQKRNGSLKSHERLFPKMPFVFGGEYSTDNLVLKNELEVIDSKYNIYKQIKNIVDGELIVIDSES